VPTPPPGDGTSGYRTSEVVRVTGCSYRQLDYWDRIDFIKPSVRAANGSGEGRERRYSDEDVRLLTLTKRLLDIGFSLRAIRTNGPDALAGLLQYAAGSVHV
jgi:DNA-binding transcriptional MerR regulator